MMRSPGCPFYREFTAPVLVVVGLALLLTSLLGNTLHAAALINLGSLELSRARLNADQESADPALNSFLKAERVAPTLVGVPRQELRLVQAHLVLGDMSSATAASESITSTAAERRMAFALLGDAYLMRGDAKQAVIALQQVGAVLQLADLGSKALRERNPDLAIQAWQAAQRVWARRGEVGPYEAQEAIEVHYGLAQIWIEQGDTDAALREYKALIQLLPENPTTYWQIGDLYRVQGKYELANEWLQKARALSPGSYRPYYHLGLLAADQGQWDVAASWQRQALARARAVGLQRPFIQVELAQACEAMGDFDCARKAYEDLISHLPNSVKYRLELAGLYEQMGYLDMAAEQYRQVLQLEPRNTEAAERLKAITTQ